MARKLARNSAIPRGKGVDCLGKGEIASWRTQKSRGKFPVINNLGHGEARARPKFPPSHFPEVFPMTAPAIPAPAKGRLGNGQLRRQVAEWLAARPGPHTVGEIAKDLGRSAGAVGNALTTLADRLHGQPA
jgi:hypothetical protein